MPDINSTIQPVKSKIMSKKIIIASIIALVVLGVISYPLFFKKMIANAQMAGIVAKAAATNPQVTDMYAHVMQKQATFDKNKNNGVEQYLSLAFSWKSLADQIKNPVIYQRALDVYEAGILKFNKTNSLLYINAAQIYRQFGNYEMAEKRYLQALQLDPGDTTTQLTLIDLYKKDMKKPVEFVKARYQLASKTVLNQFPIANSFAVYLRELGEYDKALTFYQALYQADPRPEFKVAIQELEAAIKAKK